MSTASENAKFVCKARAVAPAYGIPVRGPRQIEPKLLSPEVDLQAEMEKRFCFPDFPQTAFPVVVMDCID